MADGFQVLDVFFELLAHEQAVEQHRQHELEHPTMPTCLSETSEGGGDAGCPVAVLRSGPTLYLAAHIDLLNIHESVRIFEPPLRSIHEHW